MPILCNAGIVLSHWEVANSPSYLGTISSKTAFFIPELEKLPYEKGERSSHLREYLFVAFQESIIILKKLMIVDF